MSGKSDEGKQNDGKKALFTNDVKDRRIS